jgi:hypothetical protein
MKTISTVYLLAMCVVLLSFNTGCNSTSNDSREPFLPLMDAELHNYAAAHNGWYPSDTDDWKALAKLYPNYSASGVELAGLSGNIQQVTNALQRGHSISNLTSWTYVTGLRNDDDPQLAILWESKSGVTADGNPSQSNGRMVLFLNGDVTNIPRTNWVSFLRKQEQLRKAAQSSHKEAPPS